MSYGLETIAVSVEADVSEGMPCFDMVGFLSSEVKEARERVRTALKNSGYHIPAKRITINLTPADFKKTGNGCDLPVAAAVLASFGVIEDQMLKDYLILGEVGLNGTVLPVKGILAAAIFASEHHWKGIILPEQNAREASVLSDIQIFPIRDLESFVSLCRDEFPEECQYREAHKDIWEPHYDVDFSQVHGQPMLRRACEIAVSGMHNLLMIGTPGSGKSMVARRIPTILPELTREEKLELSQIYSLCGLLDDHHVLQKERPFRSPHHTATMQSIVGGGRYPKPGEISLAHNGILFLDELPEFSRDVLETLREPLEERRVHIARAGRSVTFPAKATIVAAMNSCPCGAYPDMQKCTCSAGEIQRYVGKISQALLHRFDLCVEARELTFSEMHPGKTEEDSGTIRRRVERVHQIQQTRYQGKSYSFNSQVPNEDMEAYCPLESGAREKMEQYYVQYGLNARTYYKLLRTARTIADMEETEQIRERHLEEALLFRTPDPRYWRRY